MAQYNNIDDDKLIDLTMKAAYEHLPVAVDINRQVFVPNGIELNRRQISRITRIMVSTGLLKAKGGYGDDSRMTLTDDGIKLMKNYKGYFGYLWREREERNNLINSETLIINVKTPQNKPPITPQRGNSFWHEHPWAKAILWIIAVSGGIATIIGVILQI